MVGPLKAVDLKTLQRQELKLLYEIAVNVSGPLFHLHSPSIYNPS